MNDIKVLETEGLNISMSKSVIHGTIVQVTRDNLCSHGLFGFVEYFSARYCCRFCLLEKACFQTVFCEDNPEVVLRTIEMHAQH